MPVAVGSRLDPHTKHRGRIEDRRLSHPGAATKHRFEMPRHGLWSHGTGGYERSPLEAGRRGAVTDRLFAALGVRRLRELNFGAGES